MRQEKPKRKKLTRKEKEAEGGEPPLTSYAKKEMKRRADLAALPKEAAPEPVEEVRQSVPKPVPVLSHSGKELRGEGRVINYHQKGFGFIETSEGNVFFHANLLQGGTARDGMALSFVATLNPQGWKATEVAEVSA